MLTDTVGTVKDAAYISSLPENANVIDAALTFATRIGDAFPSEKMRITSGGNVGIGTTSPSVKLQVEDSSSTSLTTLYLVNSSTAAVTTKQNNLSFRMTDTVGTRKNAFQLTAYSDSTGGNIENGGLIFSGRKADLDTEFMRITSGGNVGIGTSSPNAILDVYTSQGGSTIAATHGTGGSYPKASGISFGATST
jgi:hypothetical protein